MFASLIASVVISHPTTPEISSGWITKLLEGNLAKATEIIGDPILTLDRVPYTVCTYYLRDCHSVQIKFDYESPKSIWIEFKEDYVLWTKAFRKLGISTDFSNVEFRYFRHGETNYFITFTKGTFKDWVITYYPSNGSENAVMWLAHKSFYQN